MARQKEHHSRKSAGAKSSQRKTAPKQRVFVCVFGNDTATEGGSDEKKEPQRD